MALGLYGFRILGVSNITVCWLLGAVGLLGSNFGIL